MIGRAASGLAALAVSMTALALSCNPALATSVAAPAWKMSIVPQPANLPIAALGGGEPADQYALVLTNRGGAPSSGTVTVVDHLPVGVTAKEPVGGPGWGCAVSPDKQVVTCVNSEEVPALGQSLVAAIPVAVSVAGVLTTSVTSSGGGAPAVITSLSTVAGPDMPQFGFLDFSNEATAASGAPEAQAAGHPFALTTALDFPQRELGHAPEKSIEVPRSMKVDLPAGLVGDPQAASKCTIIAVFAQHCSASSRVGTLFLNLNQGLFSGRGEFAVYNVIPESGYPAEFAFYAYGLNEPGFMYATVRTGGDYGLHLTVPDIPFAAETSNAIVTFFGDPQGMDGGGNASTALLTNPSACSGIPLTTRIEADSWEAPGRWVPAEASMPPLTGCERLQFQPGLELATGTTRADEPTGYTVDVRVPQSQSQSVQSLATPDLKDATVTLPEGVSISPGAADGLVGCPAEGHEGINLTSPGAGSCPLASQIGTVRAETPLLEEPAHGHLYVAAPNCGGEGQESCSSAAAARGDLFGLYLELEDAGVIVKQHGTASVNPDTGQITASFKNAPQLPFGDLKLTLKDGARAPLSNPQTCGEALATSDMTPWSSPYTPDATPSWAFPVTGCEGSPFSPFFEAGTTTTTAGTYTNFTTTFSRSDRQQDLSAIQVQTPPGLLGVLAHVALCEEPQAAAGTCSPASQIGTASASAGSGSQPFWVSGPVYLTGPYNGAPFGLSIPIQAKAGPFNLGTIVTRAMINIDQKTSALTITSNPLPQIFRGVPLRVQTVNVTVNKSQFMFNPTNCDAKQVTATIVSAQNAVAHVSSPFAAGGCKNLPFNPGFKVATRAPGSKKKGTSFDVKVSSAPGGANIHSISVALPKQLPSRLTTIQQACPEVTFAANPATCPAGSLIGFATGTTPVLSAPVTGPAYLVSHGGAAFPDLKLILQAEGVRVDLTGSINIKGQITSSTFASIPDVPISSFELKLPEGPHSALTPNGNLCTKALVMPTTIVGQNGRRLVRSTKVAVAGCPKKPKTKKKRHK